MPRYASGKLRYTGGRSQLEVPDGVFVTNDIAVVATTAMSLGATSSDIVTTRRFLQSPDGPIRVTQTKITFEFLTPGPESRFRVPPGYTLHEATLAMLTGEHPLPARPTYRTDSPISISTGSPPPSPEPHLEDGAHSSGHVPDVNDSADIDLDDTGRARRTRRALRKHMPPEDRWYCVTRGRLVGIFQGRDRVLGLTHSVRGAALTFHTSRELAEEAFNIALHDRSVEVLY
ncbi:hypothetical protein HWV62_13797 [Athelia sp. TMB]|nr:hypothetical protein HWV62_13797 [Athelia sp. TMB]